MKNQPAFLTIAAGIMLFAFAACQSASDPLDGTSWELVTMNGTSLISDRIITANFENGQVGGSSGCNSYGGNYQVDGNKIAVSNTMSTMMACPEPEGVMGQETLFLSALSQAQTFRLADSQLEIIASDGSRLTFNPQP